MKLISATEAAKELGISRARIHQLLAADRIEGVTRFGKLYMVQSPVKIKPGKRRGKAKKAT